MENTKSRVDASTRRRRPPALAIGCIAAHREHATPWPPRNEDIPMFRTFIDFGRLTRLTDSPPDSPPSTAPARLGVSMRGVFDSWEAVATSCDSSASSASCTITPTPPGSSDSSTRVSAASVLDGFQLPLTSLSNGAGSRQSSGSPSLRALRSPSFEHAPQAELCWRSPSSCYEEVDKAPLVKQIKLVDHLGANDADDGESTDDGESSDGDEGLCPAYSENAALPSVGSAAHGEEKCKRCCFFPKGRCSNGYECQFCHFAHEKRKNVKSKKKKSRRRRQRQNSMGDYPPSSRTQLPQASSMQQFLGRPLHWALPQQTPSKLIVHNLQFVPLTVTVNDLNFLPTAASPSHQNIMPELQMWHGC